MPMPKNMTYLQTTIVLVELKLPNKHFLTLGEYRTPNLPLKMLITSIRCAFSWYHLEGETLSALLDNNLVLMHKDNVESQMIRLYDSNT